MRASAKIAAVMLAGLATGAPAAESPRWFFDAAGGADAKWGIPKTDAVGFQVVCGEKGWVVLRPALYATEQPATAPNVKFDIDGEAYSRTARLEFQAIDGAWQATVTVPADGSLIDAMRKGSRLTYDFDPPLRQGDRFTVSLTGSAKAIDEVLSGC